MPGRRFIFWSATIPFSDWSVPLQLVDPLVWCKGQAEESETGYKHWQLVFGVSRKLSLLRAKELFCDTCHLEPSRSIALEAYVWKEATRIPGSQFELGFKPVNPASKTDWELVWQAACAGRILEISANIRVQHYRTLRCIASDYSAALETVRTCWVYWGKSGTGKSRRAWEEATFSAYTKSPRTKFWDGYQGEKCVVLDEFRGGIDVSYLLRWTDRYPCRVEIKGSSMPLCMTTLWITSNLSPDSWYPDLDSDTLAALKRRLNIVYFP